MKSKVLLSLFAVAAALFITGCSRTPSETVEKYFSACIKGDANEANEYCTGDMGAITSLVIAGMKEEKITSVTVTGETINGDNATVNFKDNTGDPGAMKLVKVDGDWKIAEPVKQ